MADYAELVFEVKNINKTIRDIVKVRKEIEKTGKETKNLQSMLVSGWSFGKVFQSLQKFGDAFRDVQVTLRSFSQVYGNFNKIADDGVKMLISDFQETEKSAKKLLNLLGSRTINLGLDPQEFARINVELARITQEISAATGMKLEEVGKKLSQSLAGEVGGLKDLGIIINSSGDKFKDAVSKLKTTGLTEEAAQAMVVFGEIKKQTQKFDGSFKEGAKSISQSFNNISNTLESGIFAKAGETLSTLLSPLLNVVDALLSNDIVKHIGGITVAIGTLTVSVLLLKKAVGGFSEFIGLSGVIGKGGSLLAKLAPGLTKAIMGLLPVVTGALTSLGTALVAALPYVLVAAIAAGLTAALVKTVQLIKREGFAGAAKAIWEWFRGLGESIVNWFKGKDFKSNKEIGLELEEKQSKEFAKKLDELKEKLNSNLDEIGKAYAEFFKDWKSSSAFSLLTKSEPSLSVAEIKRKILQSNTDIINKLEMNQDLMETLGKTQENFLTVVSTYFSRLKTDQKFTLYDTLVDLQNKFGEEFQKAGIQLKKLKTRVNEAGETIVSEAEIDEIFGSFGFDKEFLKIRELMLNKFQSELTNAANVNYYNKKQTGKEAKGFDKQTILKNLGLDKTFDFFNRTSKEVLDEVYKKLHSDESYKNFGGYLLKIKEEYKDIFEKIKKGNENWKLDNIEGMELSKFKELTQDPSFRLQVGELLKALGKNTIKNIEDVKNIHKDFLKMRGLLMDAINKEVETLKNWKTEKWNAITNNFDILSNFKIPGVDNLKERLERQKEKIKKFKELFDFDRLIKEVKIPDDVNSKTKYNELKNKILSNTEKLVETLKISKKDLDQLSDNEIEKRVDKALESEKYRLEALEEVWKKQNNIYSDKEKINLLKELQQHYMEKFNIEMEGLEKERQYIEETNSFIQQSLSKALDWVPQGISAITENSMEGYKFMTSGYKDLGNFSSVINQKNNQEITLQTRANDLISRTKDVVSEISRKIDDLVGNTGPSISVVN